jgi:hypothetical protein
LSVGADPVPHAQERGHRVAVQRALEVAVQARDLAQEGGRVVRQRVLDLVGHRQLHQPQHARLPQLGHARAQQRLVVGALALGGQAVAFAHQLGDRALGVEDALALHLGRVRGQHRADVRLRQHRGHVAGAQAGLEQALQAHAERAFLQVAFALVHLAPPHVVAVLGDVGQVAEVAEGADHAHRLVARQVLQQPVEHAPGRRVTLEPVGHRELAHALDQLEGLVPFLLANHVAEDAAEQPDVLDQRAVLGGGIGACGGSHRV